MISAVFLLAVSSLNVAFKLIMRIYFKKEVLDLFPQLKVVFLSLPKILVPILESGVLMSDFGFMAAMSIFKLKVL